MAATSGSTALRESIWVYPIVESIHVLTLCLFVGFAVVLDLRLLGILFTDDRTSRIASRLLPWTASAFGVMVVSGALLFYSDPARFYGNVFFRVKVVMLILAGLNALVFHRNVYQRVSEWDSDHVPPASARFAGGASLTLWAGIIVTGRLIAYNWFN
jgi:hypothetical protein